VEEVEERHSGAFTRQPLAIWYRVNADEVFRYRVMEPVDSHYLDGGGAVRPLRSKSRVKFKMHRLPYGRGSVTSSKHVASFDPRA
jgi:hypothetical protein